MHALNDAVYWHGFADAAQVFGGMATVGGVLIAILAAALAGLQIAWSRRVTHEAGALETHRSYLLMCIDRPELSSSDMMLEYLVRKTFVGILQEPTARETERALWFLSYVLHTMEQLLTTTRTILGADPAWVATVHSQLDYHAPLIQEVWADWKCHYGKRLDAAVQTAVFNDVPPH